jgi:hypothetical protein
MAEFRITSELTGVSSASENVTATLARQTEVSIATSSKDQGIAFSKV